jgi:hypothetical protein
MHFAVHISTAATYRSCLATREHLKQEKKQTPQSKQKQQLQRQVLTIYASRNLHNIPCLNNLTIKGGIVFVRKGSSR